MNTSEQLKNEAIRKAWIAEIGEEAFELLHSQIRHEDGGLSVIGEFDLIKQTREILGEKLQETDKFKFDGRNLYLVALSGIENNNGWTRIEPDGSNLPIEYGEYECVLKWINQPMRRLFFRCGGSDDAENTKYWLETVSHYRPIEVFKKPIF